MNTHSVKSFNTLAALSLRLKHKDVEVTRCGSHYRARFKGSNNSVFGATAEEAKQRLLSAIAKKRGIVPSPITAFETQLLEACR